MNSNYSSNSATTSNNNSRANSDVNINIDNNYYKESLPLPTTLKDIMKGLLQKVVSKDLERDLPLLERLSANTEDKLLGSLINVMLDYDMVMLTQKTISICKEGLKDSLYTIMMCMPQKVGPSTLNVLFNYMEKFRSHGLGLEIKVIAFLLKRIRQQDLDIQVRVF